MEYLEQGKTDKKTSKLTGKSASKLVSKSKNKMKNKPSENEILEYCKTPRTLKEITSYFGFKDVDTFKNNYLKSLLEKELLRMIR